MGVTVYCYFFMIMMIFCLFVGELADVCKTHDLYLLMMQNPSNAIIITTTTTSYSVRYSHTYRLSLLPVGVRISIKDACIFGHSFMGNQQLHSSGDVRLDALYRCQ